MANLDQKCDIERWKTAQKRELQEWKNFGGNIDWNNWWKKKFDDYNCLKEQPVDSFIEVGCGPFAWNTTFIIEALGKTPSKVILSDPLIHNYLDLKKRVVTLKNELNAEVNADPLEKLKLEQPVDCIVCINVLDHCYDADLCFNKMHENLNKGGLIIFGQDLTSEEDGAKHPDPGVMHPIRFDEAYANKYLSKYKTIFRKVLPRNEGRNPPYHYATMLFIGRK